MTESNGREKSVSIRSSPLKLLMAIFTLLIFIIPLVMAYGALTEKVDNLGREVIDFEKRIIILEKIAAGTEVSLSNIEDDISDIKDILILNSEE